jgi:hypothetical protein
LQNVNESSQPPPQTAAARLKRISDLRPRLAIALGSGFHHVLTGLRAEKPVAMRSLLD